MAEPRAIERNPTLRERICRQVADGAAGKRENCGAIETNPMKLVAATIVVAFRTPP